MIQTHKARVDESDKQDDENKDEITSKHWEIEEPQTLAEWKSLSCRYVLGGERKRVALNDGCRLFSLL